MKGQQALATRVRGGTLVVEMRLNLNMQSLTLEEVVSKRRKVVKDMVTSVSADFEQSLPKSWKSLDEEVVGRAHKCLKTLLEPTHTAEADHYNNDANLGGAINEVVVRSRAVRSWADGVAVRCSLLKEWGCVARGWGGVCVCVCGGEVEEGGKHSGTVACKSYADAGRRV